jgi:type II secretory pathway pseudopilin PulG
MVRDVVAARLCAAKIVTSGLRSKLREARGMTLRGIVVAAQRHAFPLTNNPPTPLWNNPLPPFPLNKGGQRGLYKGEGDWGRGVVVVIIA